MPSSSSRTVTSQTQCLTAHLRTISTHTHYAAAAGVDATFLRSAGSGTLPHARLALWLSQDKIYAGEAYPRFIGSLIALLPSSSPSSFAASSASSGGYSQDLRNRMLKVLVFALQNVVREVGFFGETSRKWGLDLEGWRERKGTMDYTAEMARAVSPAGTAGGMTGGFEEGMVFLWAMEQVYLDAWSFVKAARSSSPTSVTLTPTEAALNSFVDNWTCQEFVEFVDELGAIVNSLPISQEKAEAVWERVVELEAAFWPEDGEEARMRT